MKIGIGQDQPKGVAPEAAARAGDLDYETWLGPAPQQPYMEDRVHPQNSLGRPGWITTEDFGLGMITNWGAHHVDIMQWGLGQELGGPLALEGRATFMQNDVWTVHHTYHVEMMYPGDVRVILDHEFPNGIRFEGTDGWVFCARGAGLVTSSDPGAAAQEEPARKSLDASKLEILTAPYGPKDVALAGERRPLPQLARGDHQPARTRSRPWTSRRAASRRARRRGSRMKLQRKLTWDPKREVFVNDAEANALRGRKPALGGLRHRCA